MSEVQPSDILLRCGGRTLLRHGVLAVAGGRKVHSPSYRLIETFSRADASTCATYIDRDGIVRTALANTPRIEWVDLDGDGTRETPVVLLEGSRPNSCLQSETFGTTWVPTRSSVSSNADTAPDGTVTADRLIEDATAGATHPIIQGVTITANENCAISVHAKAGTRTWIALQFERLANGAINAQRYFNLATGALGTASGNGGATLIGSGIVPLGNGEYRCYVSGNIGGGFTDGAIRVALATGDGVSAYNGDGASYASLWGGQFERAAAFPSSYIKTVGSLVTRAADALSIPYNFGTRDVTIVAQFYRPFWADAAGSIGSTRVAYELASALPSIQLLGQSASRTWQAIVDTATTDSSQTAAIPAGTLLTVVSQFKNLLTAPQAALDTGSGLSAFAGAGTPFSAYGNQTLRIGGSGGSEFFGGLVDLKVLAGLRSYAEATVVP